MNNWQPIETAPKDGTFILLHVEHFGLCQGYWCEEPVNIKTGEDAEPCWMAGLSAHFCRNVVPTHWMPLPEVPNE